MAARMHSPSSMRSRTIRSVRGWAALAISATLLAGCGQAVAPLDGPPHRAAAAAQTTQPQPSDGDVFDKIPVRAQRKLPPVALSQTVSVDQSVSARVVDVRRTTAEARMAGEIGGEAASVRVRLTNRSAVPVDVGNVTVAVSTGKSATPLIPMYSDATEGFTGSLAAGKSTEATYVFSTVGVRPGALVLQVNYAADAPVAVFTGDLP